MGVLATTLILVGVFAYLRTRTQRTPLKVGTLYSVDAGEWGFRVAKVLAVEPGAVHIRLYKRRWSSRPANVENQDLTLGKPDDPDGFGVGHLPLRAAAFHAWRPMLISEGSVSPEELEGYNMWKEAKGGLF